MNETKFDFEDERGKIPAHRHINKNGYEGGWVEDNCTVSEDSYVSSNSRVYNNSSVYNSRVDNSSVYNNSRVDNSRVYNNSSVDNSSVYNSSVDKTKISNTKQIYTQCPIGSRNDKCTAFIGDEDTEIRIVAGCFRGDLKEFEAAILETHGHSNYGKEYLAFIENAKTYFEIWGYLKK